MTYSPYNPTNNLNLKQLDKHNLSVVSKSCGGAVVAFVLIQIIIGMVLSSIPNFYDLYKNNNVFSNAFSSILSIIAIGGTFLIAYYLLKKKKMVPDLPLGTAYDKNEAALLIPVCVMICFIGSFASSILSTLVDTWFGITFTQPDDTASYIGGGNILLAVVSTAVIPAFVEEFAIRGVVLGALRKYGDKFAIIMSAIVFALMHGNMIQIPFAFIAGIAISYAVIKTGSLWTGVAIHFVNNLFAVISMVAYSNLSSIVYAVVMLSLYAVVFVGGIICAICFTKKNQLITSDFSQGECISLTTGEKVTQFIFTAPMIIAIGILVYETSLYIS